MAFKDVFLCMKGMYCINVYKNVTSCKYYSFGIFMLYIFNVSSTKINARVKLSRYV
jgi:hypothetical protein